MMNFSPMRMTGKDTTKRFFVVWDRKKSKSENKPDSTDSSVRIRLNLKHFRFEIKLYSKLLNFL